MTRARMEVISSENKLVPPGKEQPDTSTKAPTPWLQWRGCAEEVVTVNGYVSDLHARHTESSRLKSQVHIWCSLDAVFNVTRESCSIVPDPLLHCSTASLLQVSPLQGGDSTHSKQSSAFNSSRASAIKLPKFEVYRFKIHGVLYQYHEQLQFIMSYYKSLFNEGRPLATGDMHEAQEEKSV
ncbi:hypothetical protein E2C01_032566 [Portunus trituberculatus]|uniref:Uncharacterized protein n=1 Tax=Portunus trituberculatus TaxID=210409 RepID=A0A5B7F0L8_PORTR|nr:hypothetical protein [Portunus trituberculatus]